MLNENSAAATTGNSDIYQNFFICFSYETRKVNDTNRQQLYIQYGLSINTDETTHLYMTYLDLEPLEPVYYSFGSRASDVEILNARVEKFNVDEQIRLRCSRFPSQSRQQLLNLCDYKCHKACDGCTSPYLVSACKKCAHASISINSSVPHANTSIENTLCVESCPNGYRPNLSKANFPCEGNFTCSNL